MTPSELSEESRRRRDLGHEAILLVVRRSTPPPNRDRVFVIPGLYGRYVGEIARDGTRRRFLIDVRLDDVERRLRTSTTGYDLKPIFPAAPLGSQQGGDPT